MEKSILVFGNLYFHSKGKKDLLFNEEEFIQRIISFYKSLLTSLLQKQSKLISLKKFRKLHFDSSLFEYSYPTEKFFSECTTKMILKNNLVKIKKTLLILLEIFQFFKINQKKREIYYKKVNDFNSQSSLDEVIRVICIHLGAKRSWLRIFPSYKGLVFGRLLIRTNGQIYNLANPLQKEIGITISFQDFEIIESEIEFVLIVEKETVFSDLLVSQITKRLPYLLIITAKGYPDLVTKKFIKNLFNCNPDVLFLYLGDFDPFGIDILLDYLFSSPLAVFENCNLPVILPVGLSFDDLDIVSATSFVDLTDNDVFKIYEILERPMFQLNKPKAFTNDFEKIMRLKLEFIRGSLEWLKEKGRKLEIESLVVSKIDLVDYLSFKINKLTCI